MARSNRFGNTLYVDVEHPNRRQGEPARIRVVIADDSVLLREGIARLLEDSGFEIVGQSGTAEDLLLKVRRPVHGNRIGHPASSAVEDDQPGEGGKRAEEPQRRDPGIWPARFTPQALS